jgi:hypothetical protein
MLETDSTFRGQLVIVRMKGRQTIFISKMYFCHWEPLAVFENCRTRIPGWLNPQVDWTDTAAFRSTWEALAKNLEGYC